MNCGTIETYTKKHWCVFILLQLSSSMATGKEILCSFQLHNHGSLGIPPNTHGDFSPAIWNWSRTWKSATSGT